MVMTSIKNLAIMLLLWSGLAYAADEGRQHLEQQKHRFMLEVEGTRARIDQIRVEAMEHEAMAKQLHVQAARMENELRQEVDRRKRDLEITEAEIKMHQLLQEARQLESRGHLEEAHELNTKAANIADMVRARRGEEEARKLARTKRKIDELRARSERAEREGRLEASRELWEHANQLTEELLRPTEWREQQEQTERLPEAGERERRMDEIARDRAEDRPEQGNSLRDEISDLREQMAEIRQLVESISHRAETL